MVSNGDKSNRIDTSYADNKRVKPRYRSEQVGRTVLGWMYGITAIGASWRVRDVVRFNGIPIVGHAVAQRAILYHVISYGAISVESSLP